VQRAASPAAGLPTEETREPVHDPEEIRPMRVLLSTVYRPFCVDDPFDSPANLVQHGTCHRQFTREQGIFTIHQQSSHLALHLIAENIRSAADVEVLEYPELEELAGVLEGAVREGRPFDFVGITCAASNIRKARRMCETVKRISPGTETVIGGGGSLAVGEIVQRFSDHVCRGEGVRFFRELLGEDPALPLAHPVVPSIHFPNTIMGCRANAPSFSLAVTLGCTRGCEFCATSAQFGRARIPLLASGAEILAAMRRAEREHAASRGGRAPALSFILFDENLLSDEPLARELLRLNREQLSRGTLYLPFLFSDASSIRRYTARELLEMGVDALWVGMESADRVRFEKNEGVDFRALVRELQENGIKVFVSFIAGLEDQTAASIERDIEYALELGAAGYQYAMACPLPGTPYFERLLRAGKLAVERPEQLNMSHYYIRHAELDEETLRAKTSGFQRCDYERHGPLALRYARLRLSGLRKHRRSPSPALRARARGFRNDLFDAAGILSVGPVFAPNPAVRRAFEETRRELRAMHLGPGALLDLVRGRATLSGLVQYLLFTTPLVEPLARLALVARALRADPRTRTRCGSWLGLLRNGRACIAEARRGVMPWSQPSTVRTRYERRRDAAIASAGDRGVPASADGARRPGPRPACARKRRGECTASF
jgi:radical SAM superfamily enzyme YgiQ (UPF0313 family)